MKLREHLSRAVHSGATRDLILISAGAVAVFLLAAKVDLLEEVMEWLHEHDGWQLDEVIIVMVFLSIAMSVFAIRRYQDLKQSLNRRRVMEEALAKSEERFQLVARATKDAIWDWNLVTKEMWWNDNLPHAYGYDAEELEQSYKSWLQRLHPDDVQRVMREHDSLLNGKGKTWTGEYRFQRRDESYAYVLDRAYVVHDSNGRPVRMLGSMVDLTTRKQEELAVRTRELMLSEAQRVAQMGSWQVDLATGKVMWSDELWHVFGLKPQAEGLDLEGYLARVHPDDRDRVRLSINEAIAAKRDFSFDYRLVRPDTRIKVIRANRKLVRGEDGALVAILGTDQDVTLQRAMEEDLKHARDAAVESAKLKSEFLANMSHEIRTPMNGIIGMTELTLDTTLTNEQRGYLGMVKESADSLMSIINDILDFSKIEAGKLDLESVDFTLSDLLRNTLTPLGVRADQKGLELTYNVDPKVPDALVGDPHRLRQIILNLVGNSIKFTDAGDISISVAEDYRSEQEIYLHFEIRDTGIGIAHEKQKMIFESFSQADGSTTRRYGGTGLGLAITAQLVKLMGGEITVESDGPTKGSIFHFTVCLGYKLENVVNKQSTLKELAGARVLVVDDNATNRLILEKNLALWRMSSQLVDNGRSAIDEMKLAVQNKSPFDLVLLDAQMPGLDGFDVLRTIRESPELAGASIMMLSSAGHTARCQELGLDSYLVKPIGRAALLAEIRKVFDVYHAKTESLQNRSQVRNEPGVKSLNILLAEDNPINQQLATRVLEKRGHQVSIANNGREAVEQFAQQEFDLVLMDIQMPEMNGFEATGKIRELELKVDRRVPIVAMTAYAMKGDLERCLTAGMDAYVSKPIKIDELMETVARLTSNVAPPGVVAESAVEINFESILARSDGDESLARDLIDLFLVDAPKLALQINSAIVQQNSADLEQAAHTLKGAVGYFTVGASYELARSLELSARSGDFESAKEQFESLEQALSVMLPALSTFVEPVSA
jgi:two-component system, sensor histidine kinase and response regulator